MRSTGFITALLTLFAAQAFAEDHDRSGLLFGASAGLSQHLLDMEGDTHDGFAWNNGFNGALRGGYGFSGHPITLDFELDFNYDRWDGQHRYQFAPVAGADYFFGDFYLRLGLGAKFEILTGKEHRYGDLEYENGLDLYPIMTLGAGYEFFVTPHLAMGLRADLQNAFFIFPDLGSIQLTISWY